MPASIGDKAEVWTAVFTGLIMVLLGIHAVLFRRQARQLRKTVKAMIAAEKRASAEVRADANVIGIKYWEGNDRYPVKPMGDRIRFPVFELTVENVGKFQAKNIQIDFSVRIAKFKETGSFNSTEIFDLHTAILKSIKNSKTETTIATISFPEEGVKLLSDRENTVYVFGIVRFGDNLGACTPNRFIYFDHGRFYFYGKGDLVESLSGNYQPVDEQPPTPIKKAG